MNPSQSSLFKALESVHDNCLSQSQQEQEMEDLESQIVPQRSYGIQHHEVQDIDTHKVKGIAQTKSKYADSGNISLSSESTDYPQNLDEIAFKIDNDSEPLQDMEICPEDFDEQGTQYIPSQCPNESDRQLTPPVYRQVPLNVPSSVTPPDVPSSSSHRPVMNEQSQSRHLPSPATGSSVSDNTSFHEMPADCEMELQVSYMSSNNTIKKSVKERDGILLYHEKTPTRSFLPTKCKFVNFPPLGEAAAQNGHNVPKKEYEDIPLTSKDKANIKQILDNMQGGLQVRCQDGCVYAKRWSKAKIFYHQCTEEDSKTELPRNHEIMIFNFYEYKDRLLEQYKLHYSNNAKLSVKDTNPVIYFTFAQKWVPGTVPLNKCLVWARLTPSLAHKLWDGLLHPNENGNKGSLTNSYQDVLHFSNEPTEYSNLPTNMTRNN